MVSPSGDQTILVRFSANHDTIQRLAERPGFTRDDEWIAYWQQDQAPWETLWRHVFSNVGQFGGRAWKEPAPMKKPVHYRRSVTPGDIGADHTELLWDADSGRAYALYTD